MTMQARFVCQPPGGVPWEIRLSRLPARLGRGEQVDVRVDDHWVSREHCQIDRRQGALIVKDLGSRHGTWINDQRVEEAEIHAGDRLGIGLTTLIAEPPRDGAHRLSFPWFVFGHIVASLLGLAIGYYVVCWLRPEEFNWWNLPVP
jgi:pSer/pThr/pTyr-binding forkhead associated (FHA) protein